MPSSSASSLGHLQKLLGQGLHQTALAAHSELEPDPPHLSVLLRLASYHPAGIQTTSGLCFCCPVD